MFGKPIQAPLYDGSKTATADFLESSNSVRSLRLRLQPNASVTLSFRHQLDPTGQKQFRDKKHGNMCNYVA